MSASVIVGLLIPFVGTTLGSAVVFFMKRSLSVNVSKALTGFAAGVMTMYAGAFLIALYKEADGKIYEEKLKGLIYALSYCSLMMKAKQGKSAFTEKEIANRTKQAKWSRDHIEEYPMNWYYYFKTVPGKDEYYITHKGFVQSCFGCVHFHLDSCHNSDLLIDRFFTEKSIGQTLLTEITKTA